jgi:hypothetical protein
MTKLPIVSGQQCIKALQRSVFTYHDRKVATLHFVVTILTPKDTLKDADITVEAFIDLL